MGTEKEEWTALLVVSPNVMWWLRNWVMSQRWPTIGYIMIYNIPNFTVTAAAYSLLLYQLQLHRFNYVPRNKLAWVFLEKPLLLRGKYDWEKVRSLLLATVVATCERMYGHVCWWGVFEIWNSNNLRTHQDCRTALKRHTLPLLFYQPFAFTYLQSHCNFENKIYPYLDSLQELSPNASTAYFKPATFIRSFYHLLSTTYHYSFMAY